MEEGVIYFILSSLSFVLAVTSAFFAWIAMKRGLTYTTLTATVWTLAILGISRVWHTAEEFLELTEKYGEGIEMVEYGLIILAYSVFVWALIKSMKIETK